jgi:nicotinamidase-related amidase
MKSDSLLLIIDIQEGFRKAIPDLDKVIDNTSKLAKAFSILGIPIVLTEQYPKGLGSTCPELKNILEDCDRIEKVSFDCFNDDSFADLIKTKYKNKKNLIIAGIESHVCVFQTALSAKKDFNVYLIADAVSSRKQSDKQIALRRLEKEGIKLASTEMIIFQMLKDSKDDNFKQISSIVK